MKKAGTKKMALAIILCVSIIVSSASPLTVLGAGPVGDPPNNVVDARFNTLNVADHLYVNTNGEISNTATTGAKSGPVFVTDAEGLQVDASAGANSTAGYFTGSKYGIQAYSTSATNSYGGLFSGLTFGVSGSAVGGVGSKGVYGSAETGVYGDGSLYGVYGKPNQVSGIGGYFLDSTSANIVRLGTSATAIDVTGDAVISPGQLTVMGPNAATGSAAIEGNSAQDTGVSGVSTSSYGVSGKSTGNSGVYGETTNISGVYGKSTSATGFGIGVYGESTNWSGVIGQGKAAGVTGTASGSTAGTAGVIGHANAGFGMWANGAIAAHFENYNNNGYWVDLGINGKSMIAHGDMDVTGVLGVIGTVNATTAAAATNGVNGTSTQGKGVYGVSTNSFGVEGKSTNNIGVVGSSTATFGVKGSTSAAGSAGVWGTGETGVTADGSVSGGSFRHTGSSNGVILATAAYALSTSGDANVTGKITATNSSGGNAIDANSTNAYGVYAQSANGTAVKGYGVTAGTFSSKNTSNSVDLGTGSYAVNATGNVNINGSLTGANMSNLQFQRFPAPPGGNWLCVKDQVAQVVQLSIDCYQSGATYATTVESNGHTHSYYDQDTWMTYAVTSGHSHTATGSTNSQSANTTSVVGLTTSSLGLTAKADSTSNHQHYIGFVSTGMKSAVSGQSSLTSGVPGHTHTLTGFFGQPAGGLQDVSTNADGGGYTWNSSEVNGQFNITNHVHGLNTHAHNLPRFIASMSTENSHYHSDDHYHYIGNMSTTTDGSHAHNIDAHSHTITSHAHTFDHTHNITGSTNNAQDTITGTGANSNTNRTSGGVSATHTHNFTAPVCYPGAQVTSIIYASDSGVSGDNYICINKQL